MRRMLLLVLGAALLALAPSMAASPAGMLPPAGPLPDAECNEDAAMDIYVGPDGVLWECVCQKMFTELDCAWYEVPRETAASRKRRARLVAKAKMRLHVRALPRMVVIRL